MNIFFICRVISTQHNKHQTLGLHTHFVLVILAILYVITSEVQDSSYCMIREQLACETGQQMATRINRHLWWGVKRWSAETSI